MSRVRVGVLCSGSGTNLAALLEATADPDHPAEIVVVGADRPRAHALTRAADAGVDSFVVLRREFPDRADFDRALVEQLRARDVTWVCHAGFMRIVGPAYLAAFPNRVLNIHPSLLPAFPGLHGQQQTFDRGVRIAGCTVHIADEGVDTGPIVAQGAVPVLPDDTIDSLQQRILRMEHRIYPLALRWAAEGRLTVDGRKVTVAGGPPTWLFDSLP